MPTSAADRNLLFGVVALQGAYLDNDQFAEICAAWATRKSTPLADLLVERAWLTPEDKKEVERAVERHLRRHGGDCGPASRPQRTTASAARWWGCPTKTCGNRWPGRH